MRNVLSALLVAAVSLLIVGCDSHNRTAASPTAPSATTSSASVVSVSIVGQKEITTGQERVFQAIAIMSDGSQQDVTQRAFWRSTNTFVCEVSDGGKLVAVNVGVCDLSLRSTTKPRS